MRKMFDWIRDTKEARIALAICAGLLLYRLVTAILSSVQRWYEDASHDTLVETAAYTITIIFIVLCVWLWRSRKTRKPKPANPYAGMTWEEKIKHLKNL